MAAAVQSVEAWAGSWWVFGSSLRWVLKLESGRLAGKCRDIFRAQPRYPWARYQIPKCCAYSLWHHSLKDYMCSRYAHVSCNKLRVKSFTSNLVTFSSVGQIKDSFSGFQYQMKCATTGENTPGRGTQTSTVVIWLNRHQSWACLTSCSSSSLEAPQK